MIRLHEKTRTLFRTGLLIFRLSAFLPAVFAFQVELKYETHTEKPEGAYRPGGTRDIQRSAERPMGFWMLPPLKSVQPIYGIVALGETRRLLVLDRQEKDDVFFNRIYFDSNGNSNLTDDLVLDATLTVKGGGTDITAHFPPVETTVYVEHEKFPYSFQPRLHGNKYENRQLSQQEIGEQVQLTYKVNCVYSGQFTLGDQRYTVCLEDRNANGRFYETFSLPPRTEMKPRVPIRHRGDWLYLTTKENFGSYDARICGDWLLIQDKVYRVAVDLVHEVMSLDPISERTCPLRLATEPHWMTIYREDGKCLMMDRPGREISVPPGAYRLLDYVVFRNDAEGDLWRASGIGSAESPWVTVSSRSDAVLHFGEPFRPTADVHANNRENLRKGNKNLPLELFVIGAGEEIMDDLQRIGGDKTKIPRSEKRPNRPKEATFKIFKADGQVLQEGKFDYG